MKEIAKDNSERAFTAFMSFIGEDRIENVAFEREDAFLEKKAGISIYQPTIENIEEFVQKYVQSETKSFNINSVSKIQLQVQKMDDFKNEYVAQATGIAALKTNGIEIDLPFIINDGDFLPFDVIQVGNQRVPYNRENLGKVINGLNAIKHDDASKGLEEFKPYLGLDQAVNPSSSVGFLGDVLRIQEQHSNRGGQAGQYWVTACEAAENLLEKLATLAPATEQDWQILEKTMLAKAVAKRKETFAKYASELEASDDSAAAELYKQASEVPWTQATAVKHGTIIHYPEVTANTLGMRKALVLKQFQSIGNFPTPDGKTVVISDDGRVKVLAKGERFLCIVPANQINLSLPTTDFKMLEGDDKFIALNGQQAMFPMHVCYINARNIGMAGEYQGGGEKRQDMYAAKSEPRNIMENKTVTVRPIGLDDYNYNITISILPGAKFTFLPNYQTFLDAKIKETGLSEAVVRSMFSSYNVELNDHSLSKNRKRSGKILVTDENTKVVKLNGEISNYVETAEAIDVFEDKMDEPNFQLSKSAGEADYIEIRLANKDDQTFNVLISYADKSQKVAKILHRTYKNMPYNQVREVLKAVGFPIPKVGELMTKAKNDSYLRVSLPVDGTPDMLQGTMLQGQVAQAVKKMRTAIFNPNFSDQVSTEVLGRAMEFLPVSPLDRAGDLAKGLKQKAAQYEATSILFEKLAMAEQSDLYKQAAALVACAAHLDYKVADQLTGTAEYPLLRKLAAEIVGQKDLLEKAATDLIATKALQALSHQENIPFSRLTAGVEALDHLYKLAFYTAQ